MSEKLFKAMQYLEEINAQDYRALPFVDALAAAALYLIQEAATGHKPSNYEDVMIEAENALDDLESEYRYADGASKVGGEYFQGKPS